MMENCSIEDPNNDDKILQCCLLFQRKGTEMKVFCLLCIFITRVNLHLCKNKGQFVKT